MGKTPTKPSDATVAPAYHELRAMLPDGSRFGLTFSDVPTPSAPPNVGLELIQVPTEHQGQGHADRVLTRLCEIADGHGWYLTLKVSTEFGSDPARLHAWYARHGFQGTGRHMHRHPHPTK